MTDPTRRRLMTVLVAGGAVAAPPRWTRPVVQAVVLPAHAQTSPPETPCGPLTLPDIEVSCADAPDEQELTAFVVEESPDQCPVLVTRPVDTEPATATLLVLRRNGPDSIGAALFVVDPDGSQGQIDAVFDSCSSQEPICEGDDGTPFTITGTSGGTYTLNAEASCDPDTGTVRVFNITIV